MQEYLTGESLFMNAVMQRQTSGKLLLLVEGDDEDRMLFGHIVESHATLLVMGGKPEVLKAAHYIKQMGLAGAIALVDRDLDDLTGASAAYPDTLLATDGYDLVSDVVATDSTLFSRVLTVHARPALEKVRDATGEDPMSAIFRLASSLTPLRLVSTEQGLGLNLRGFPFREIVSDDFLPLSQREIFEVAVGRSKSSPNWDDVEPHVALAHERTNDFKLCGGHDLLSAAAAVLFVAGERQASVHGLAKSLFVAVSCEVVPRLPLYAPVQRWAAFYSRSVFDCELAA